MSNKTDNIEVKFPARIAVYDDFKSNPRTIDVEPEETRDFIGHLSSRIYELSHEKGSKIAFSVIKQVCENYIHAGFKEMVISIFPDGEEIRFSDQGPGIENVENALKPGFSTATQEMKKYIDGVGSGLPITKEYLSMTNGEILIENNLKHGCVITLKQNKDKKIKDEIFIPENSNVNYKNSITLNKRQTSILYLLQNGETFGNKQIAEELNLPQSSVHNELNKLQEIGFVEKVGTKRYISDSGKQFINNL